MQDSSNISSMALLSAPGFVCTEYPLSSSMVQEVSRSRRELEDILRGRSRRLAIIVGPSSIHHPEAALEYATKLKALSKGVEKHIMIIMRVYFEKPRTRLGWKGLIYDPDINGEYNIEKGIGIARKLLCDIVRMNLPVATEILDPVTSSYFSDAITWGGIEARTSESQVHRQFVSGFPAPVGFKNATDGNIQPAMDAIMTARSPHSFIGVMKSGHIGVFKTKGNPYCHLVLRGGSGSPNYSPTDMKRVRDAFEKEKIPSRVIVDCSHANSNKDYTLQGSVFNSVLQQYLGGEKMIRGMMLGSYLREGKQKVSASVAPRRDVSITDACISWEETERLVVNACEKMDRE